VLLISVIADFTIQNAFFLWAEDYTELVQKYELFTYDKN